MTAHLLAAALPAGVVLRPRFGHFPVVLLILCLLWIGLMRLALPGFRRRATLLALSATGLLLLSWLPRIAARTWGHDLLTPAYYQWAVLPATVIQMLILLSLISAPIWVTLGLLARRRARRAVVPASPASAAEAALTSAAAPPAVNAEVALTPAAPPAGAEAALILAADPSAVSRRQVLGALAWAGPTTALFLAGYGVGVGAQQLVVRRLRLSIPGLPPALRGLRLGQVTDVHVSQDLTPIQKLAQGCELLAGERLDLLLATGDLCDNPRLLRDVLDLLGQVPARLGRFACLGNHELYLGLNHVRRSYERSALHLLEDESVRLGELTLAGLSYPHTGTPRLDPRRVPPLLDQALRERQQGTRTILLSHHPHVVKHLGGRGVDLMLAGHTHGGQVGLGEGSALEPAYGYVRGLYPVPGAAPGASPEAGQLFVSSGLGHWLPWRLNCPPEVVVIELV